MATNEKETRTELVPASRPAVVDEQAPFFTEDAIKALEAQEKINERIRAIAFKATNSRDWSNHGGNPYLEVSGSEKISVRFGIAWEIAEPVRENKKDVKGEYYTFTTTGTFWVAARPHRRITQTGTSSSRDLFFTRGADEKTGEDRVCQEDIPEMNVKKKATTNCIGRGVRSILGLNKLTWDELRQYGITSDGRVNVAYQSAGSKAAESKTGQAAQGKAKLPYWKSEWQGKEYINARTGDHFTDATLQNLKMKPGKTAGNYSCFYSDAIWKALEAEYASAEELRAQAAKDEAGGAS